MQPTSTSMSLIQCNLSGEILKGMINKEHFYDSTKLLITRFLVPILGNKKIHFAYSCPKEPMCILAPVHLFC